MQEINIALVIYLLLGINLDLFLKFLLPTLVKSVYFLIRLMSEFVALFGSCIDNIDDQFNSLAILFNLL